MIHTRRDFIRKGSAGVTAAIAFPHLKVEGGGPVLTEEYSIEDPKIKQLAQAAVDAAMADGATYADASLTHIYNMQCWAGSIIPNLMEEMSFGVRALYDGYWGFAASPTWTSVEAARLGKAALRQARINAFDKPRPMELAPLIGMSSGHWTMPVQADPFKISLDEILDFIGGLFSYVQLLPKVGDGARIITKFRKSEKCFVSSMGQSVTQTLHTAEGEVEFLVPIKSGMLEIVQLNTLTPAGMGFEYFRDQDLRTQIVVARDEAIENARLPIEAIDVGRYDILIHEMAMADLVSKTTGFATQVDRVLGFEANANGTSYITEPETMLGDLKVGSSLLNISADRSETGSVNKVKWDDEGVSPIKFDIFKDGVLQNLQTNREGAGWCKDYLSKYSDRYQSFGCASTPSSLDVPMIYNADLTLKPSDDSNTIDSMREEMSDGLEMRLGGFAMDFQQVTGFGQGRFFKIKDGRKIARVSASAILFRTPEMWNNLTNIGGASSVRRFGLRENKGEPAQESYHSVYVPPALFKELTVIDPAKKG